MALKKDEGLEALRKADNQEQRDAARRQLPPQSDKIDRVSENLAEMQSENSEMRRHMAAMQEQAQGGRGGGMSKAAWEDEEQAVERALGNPYTLDSQT